MFNLTKKRENHIIQLGIIAYWWFFWLFNVVDKIIGERIFLWVGRNRLEQFTKYFTSIGVEEPTIVFSFFLLVSIAEFFAFIFLTYALIYFFQKKKEKARGALFYGLLTSLILMSFFAIGDQVFGDRVELLEHSIYWIAFVLSWFVYNREGEK